MKLKSNLCLIVCKYEIQKKIIIKYTEIVLETMFLYVLLFFSVNPKAKKDRK